MFKKVVDKHLCFKGNVKMKSQKVLKFQFK